ncbi:hypothetical protein J6590_034844 [Homalodisca vitripennis]|nr:hypothetical protein J6590_034844 [Homalodisca vitripennis]
MKMIESDSGAKRCLMDAAGREESGVKVKQCANKHLLSHEDQVFSRNRPRAPEPRYAAREFLFVSNKHATVKFPAVRQAVAGLYLSCAEQRGDPSTPPTPLCLPVFSFVSNDRSRSTHSHRLHRTSRPMRIS